MARMSKDLKRQIQTRLDELEAAGELTPAAIVQEGKNKKSPIHLWSGWTWDVEKAAGAHWLDQARGLMQSFTITMKEESRTIAAPMFVRDVSKPYHEQGYVRTMSLAEDQKKAKATLLAEINRAASHIQRVRGLAMALGLEDEAQNILDDILCLRELVS